MLCCLSSLTRVYCDKTTKARITLFTLKSSKLSQFLLRGKFYEFEGVPTIEFKTSLGWFKTSFAALLPRKRGEIEHRSQLITNKNSKFSICAEVHDLELP